MQRWFGVLLIAAIAGCSTAAEPPLLRRPPEPKLEGQKPAAAPAAPEAKREVTINGRDGGMVIPQINVWDNYQTRSRIVATVHHGDKVFLIKQAGRGVLIETSSGQRGWLTKDFIDELR